MGSLIPYEFDDHDIVSPDYSVALLARYPLARLGRQFAPVDADDCAPGLETMPPQAGLAVAVVFTDAGMVHQLQRPPRRWYDVDRDRPSPGDGYRRSNDSDDGGTP